MRILYYSVHSVLEFDEITLLRGLGHDVFPLGEYFDDDLGQGMRAIPDRSPAHTELLARFHAEGCRFTRFTPPEATLLTPGFVELFDLVIVMDSTSFVIHHWEALHRRPVVLRTVGVALPHFEPAYAALRERGVRILRSAETEARAAGYAGHDAVIRFPKDPSEFAPWQGQVPVLLSFAMALAQRFPEEYGLWRAITEGKPAMLGGASNEGAHGAIGFQLPAQQRELLCLSRAYVACSGIRNPNTLNFIEAWMAGIPIIALDPAMLPHLHDCTEWPLLIRPGEDALLARSAAEAREMAAMLLQDQAMAQRIGAAGRESATRIFGTATIAPQWQAFLARI